MHTLIANTRYFLFVRTENMSTPAGFVLIKKAAFLDIEEERIYYATYTIGIGRISFDNEYFAPLNHEQCIDYVLKNQKYLIDINESFEAREFVRTISGCNKSE